MGLKRSHWCMNLVSLCADSVQPAAKRSLIEIMPYNSEDPAAACSSRVVYVSDRGGGENSNLTNVHSCEVCHERIGQGQDKVVYKDRDYCSDKCRIVAMVQDMGCDTK